MSPEAKALLFSLLSKDYESRGTIDTCMQHPWVAKPLPRPPLSPCLRSALRNMAAARPLAPLKKALLQLIFTLVLSSQDLREARKAFQELDTDRDGAVTEEELRVQIYRLFPEEQAQAALTAIANTAAFSPQRKLAYSEFLLWAVSRQAVCSPANLSSAFRLLDRDNDRKVTGTELREVLSIEPDDNTDSFTWRLLMVDISNSSEGTFNYARFAQFLA